MLVRLILLAAASTTLIACSNHHRTATATPPTSLTSLLATGLAINATYSAITSLTPYPTISHPTPQPYTYSPDSYAAKLASCYSADNGAQFRVAETTRRFITIPRAIYPDGRIVTVNGSATGGWISNGGLPGLAWDGNIECWSTLYEFDGAGQVDFIASSVVPGASDYVLHFVVTALGR